MGAAKPERAGPAKRGFRPVRLLATLLGVALLLTAIAAGGLYGGYVWLQRAFEAPGPSTEETVLLVERGSGLIRIASQLEREGLISDGRIFRAMVTLQEGEGDLRAGEFAIPAQASMADIYQILLSGVTIQYPVTVPEGLPSAMIVEIVAAHPMLTGEIEGVPPEGDLLPETYMVDRNTDRNAVLARMADAHDALLATLWEGRAPDLPFETPEEAVILASVVEKETGIASERPLVASVFVNRLRRGIRLQSDPTIIYGITQGRPLGRGIRRSELDSTTNPYNTYQIDGLPPGPIANPGEASLAAVLNPPDTDYLFFVADGTGGHAFATTLAEHNRNVARWRQIERTRAAGGR